ncbi:Class A rhodopsin-like G-protein coupled receptor GPRfmr [Trichuris trichiura]|uniref:Class A rhodopsin-like G-protein coupled receptor GPRfmr n=1 Tax=Trichuris trichiura TaxID=36087 RepID=A0A077ZBX6_TRITR|nr:Class A rhodopsin-like G-protein coupled receptor GPRfmr [Trichuris trichiura]
MIKMDRTVNSTRSAVPMDRCNHNPYDRFSFIIRVVCIVPIVIFGLLANIINISVFRHARMRSSVVNWYLIALSVSDLIVLLGAFCMLSLPAISEESGILALMNFACFTQRWTYAIALIGQTWSVGMTVMVSTHRYFGVCYPFLAQRWCTSEKVKFVLYCTIAFSFLFNLPRWAEIETAPCWSNVYNTTAVHVVTSKMRQNSTYYVAYMMICYTTVMFGIPFLLLSLIQLNKTEDRREVRENKTTLMLVAIVIMFLICNSLAFIDNIIEALMEDNRSLENIYYTSVEISNLLVGINSSANIFIYCFFSIKYRIVCKQYFFRILGGKFGRLNARELTTLVESRYDRHRQSVKQ